MTKLPEPFASWMIEKSKYVNGLGVEVIRRRCFLEGAEALYEMLIEAQSERDDTDLPLEMKYVLLKRTAEIRSDLMLERCAEIEALKAEVTSAKDCVEEQSLLIAELQIENARLRGEILNDRPDNHVGPKSLAEAIAVVQANIGCHGLNMWRLRDAERMVLERLVELEAENEGLRAIRGKEESPSKEPKTFMTKEEFWESYLSGGPENIIDPGYSDPKQDDGLEARIAELEAELAEQVRANKMLLDEVVDLKASVKSLLLSLRRSDGELKVQYSRIDELIEANSGLVKNVNDFCAENKRLHEALEQIVRADAEYNTSSPGVSRLKHCVFVAREALEQETNGATKNE